MSSISASRDVGNTSFQTQSARAQQSSKPSVSIADTVSRLEQEYQILLPLQQDFDLVRRIEDLWKAQHQSVNSVSRHKKKHYEKAVNKHLIKRINRLYKSALISHGIENYKDSIKDSIELAIDAHDMVKLNFMCRNITENTRAEAIFYALFKDKNIFIAETLLKGHENLRIKALKKAASLGDLFATQSLLENHEELKDKIIKHAVTHDRLNIIEFLLSLGAFLSSEHRKEALILAVRQGRLSVVQALLENHEHLKPFAMSAAVSSRQIDVIEALMSAGVALSSNQRVLVVDIAAESARITTILALLENHEYLRHSARNALIRYGHFLLLHSLRDPRQLVFDKTFTLSFDDVRSDPKQYLDMVINKGFPREILLLDSLGAPIKTIDAGGVRKGFVTLLFESLTPLLHLSSSLLPILEENEENQADIENAKELFRKIGCFFSELQQANRISSDPFLIGSIFNKKFFEVLGLILNAKNDNTLHQQLAGLLKEVDPALSTLSNVIIDPQNDDFKKNFALAYGLSDLSDVNSTAEKILESYLIPARQLLIGCSEDLKKLIKTNSYESICLLFQGEEVSVEALQKALEIEPLSLLDVEFEKKVTWLKEKIASSDLVWRKKFVRWVTEREVLTPDVTIKIEALNSDPFPHTCSNTVQLPKIELDKENFLAMLEAVFDSEFNAI